MTVDGLGGGLPPTGAYTVQPTQTTIYTLHAYGHHGQSADRVLQVFVQEPPATIVSFRASRAQIRRGESTTLSWYTENCQQVQIVTTGDGAGGGTYACQGSVELRPQSTTVYSLRVTGRDGQTIWGNSVTVDVGAPPEKPLVDYFNASQATIERGQTTRLRWSTRNASRLTISELPSISQQSLSGEVDVTPQQTTTYVLRAYGEEGMSAESVVTVTVNVPVPPPSIADFRADPPQIQRGEQAGIAWSVANCSRVLIAGLLTGDLPCAGTLRIAPTETVKLILQAFGSRGELISRELTVVVIQPPAIPVIDAFYAAAPQLLQGRTTTLHWQTHDAARVELVGPESLTVPPVGWLEVRPEHTATYELRAYNSAGEMTSLRTTITVQPLARPSIDYFYATPSVVTAGRSTKLSWKANNCEWVQVVGYSPEDFGATGELDVAPSETGKVVLRAKGYNGEIIESSIMVGVAPAGMTTEQAHELLLSMMQGE